MDTTFFHRYSGVLVMMDSKTDKVVSYHFVRTEKDIYYKLALNRLREKGYIIQSITCDGRRGLMKELFNTPVQMCQFHMVAIVMRKLRKKHQSQAGKELKIIAKSLVKSSKNDFYRRLYAKPERDNNHTKSEINHSYKNFHILKRYYTKKGFYYKESKSPFRF